MESIGLFPLGIVLLPGEFVPLHIFEPRYKDLIADCLDRQSEFGLVLSDDDGMRRVGTRAAVAEVLERFPDGRMNIVVKGGDRFRIVEVEEGSSFSTAGVEPLDDDDLEPPGEDDLSACVAAFRRVAEAAGIEPPEADLDLDPASGNTAYRVAGHVELGPEVEQELLEMRSERARLIRVTELLEGVLEVVELRRLARERATGNGKVERQNGTGQ